MVRIMALWLAHEIIDFRLKIALWFREIFKLSAAKLKFFGHGVDRLILLRFRFEIVVLKCRNSELMFGFLINYGRTILLFLILT